MPRASAAEAARTALRIRQVATDLFASRGFATVSLDDVAAAAEVTRGAIYHHYTGKKGLFGAVAAHLQAQVAIDVVDAAEAAGDDPCDQLRAGAHAFLESITSAHIVRILLIDAPAVIGWQQWRRLDDENSGAHLVDALRRVGVRGDDLEATSIQLSGAMNDAALWIAGHPDPDRARRQSHEVLDRLLAAATMGA